MFIHSILTTETAQIGSVAEEHQADSIVVSDDLCSQIDLQRITPAEEEQQEAKILTEGEEKESSDHAELVSVEDDEASDLGVDCTVRDGEKSVAPSDHFLS